jgi:hypothetical protein
MMCVLIIVSDHCVCACVCVGMHVHIYMYVCVCMHILYAWMVAKQNDGPDSWMHIWYTHTYMHTYVLRTYIYAMLIRNDGCTFRAYIQTYIHTYVYLCYGICYVILTHEFISGRNIHTYIHTYIHIYIYIHTYMLTSYGLMDAHSEREKIFFIILQEQSMPSKMI